MKYLVILFFLTGLSCRSAPSSEPESEPTAVVLLHGLARSGMSMKKLEKTLQSEGFVTCNISYPSTQYRIEVLASEYVAPEVVACLAAHEADRVHFITHSMGGIIVRYLTEKENDISPIRVVMLSPPNKGSELVDELGDLSLFEWINGPAGKQLGTEEESVPNQLGVVSFEAGIITGDASLNPVFSDWIAGADDGKVSVERAKVGGMKDFLVLPVTHTFIMKDEEAIRQSVYFLKNGIFDGE